MEAHTKIVKAAPVAAWAVYLVGVAMFEVLFLALTGQASQAPQLVLVTSTLVIAALLYPLRLRLRDYIERRLREARALIAAREEAQKQPQSR